MLGIVYKSTGSWYTVKTEEGDIYECRIKGKFRIKGMEVVLQSFWVKTYY